MNTSDVRVKAIKSVKWTALGELASRSMQPIITLVLARLLTPSDFGIVAIATIAINLGQILQDFGLGKTLIQRKGQIEKAADIIFWTNITLSTCLYFTVVFAAPLFSVFFHEPRTINVLRVLCLQVILFSLVSVHQALLQRSFRFKRLFFIRISKTIIYGAVSIPLAIVGYGVWALVFGILGSAVVQTCLFWIDSSWRPRLSYDFHTAKQLMGFSFWVVLEALLIWIVGSGDVIVLGYFLSLQELGVYRVGSTFTLFIFAAFFSPLVPIVYSAFSRLQSDQEELRRLFLKICKILAFISLPVGLALALQPKTISALVFGQKWAGIEIVVALNGIMHSIGWLVGVNPELYRAMGRPDINVKLLMIQLCWYLPLYLIFAPYGLIAFCLAQLIASLISIFLHMYLSKRYLGIGFVSIVANIKSILSAIFISGVAIIIMSYYFHFSKSIYDMLFNGLTFVTLYLIILYLLDKTFITGTISSLRLSLQK